MRTLTILALALFWGATATAAGVKAEYDKHADFTRYKTWSWRRGTPAPNPVAIRRGAFGSEMRAARPIDQ